MDDRNHEFPGTLRDGTSLVMRALRPQDGIPSLRENA